MNKHYNKNFLNEIIENFDKSLLNFETNLKFMKLENIEKILNKNYEEDSEEETSRDIFQNPEKFRLDISTAAKKRKSLDTSSILSNLSMSEVFEHSTDKKLLNKNTSSLLNDLQIPNIIMEEDSNFNINTFSHNFMNNLNNYELEFPDQNEEENDINMKSQSEINLNIIKEELEKSLIFNERKRKSKIIKKIDILEISNRIDVTSGDKINEIFSNVFYQLLIKAQNDKIYIYQNNPFEMILIN